MRNKQSHSNEQPIIETVSATEMHQRRGEIIRLCVSEGVHFVVVKDGIPVVAIIPLRDYRDL